jgi:hypothetical protein
MDRPGMKMSKDFLRQTMADPSLEWLRLSTADAVTQQREAKRRERVVRKQKFLQSKIKLVDYSSTDFDVNA